MSFEITHVAVWSTEIEDRPGALASTLEAVMRAGADLDFIIVRPSNSSPGRGVLFVAPLFGAEQERAATEVGLHKSTSMHTLRILGPNRPGLGAGIARTLASAGINISGLSAAVINDRCVFYVRVETAPELDKACEVLTPKLV